MTVFVLGAGATRGASFVDEGSGGPQPPLDADFFTQLQRITDAKHQDTVRSVMSDVFDLFGANFQSTLENTFTVIEHMIRMSRVIGKRKADLERTRSTLLQAIAASLEVTLADGRTLRHCQHHDWLVKVAEPGDAIISFNYDCLIDEALRTYGDNKWNARYGYSLSLPKGRGGSIGEKHWQPDTPAKKDGTIRLLKLHGSTNFHRVGEALRLKQRPYTKQRGQIHFEIIPPEWHKRFDGDVFAKLWTAAGKEIRRADSIVVVGYSFPESDQHTSALFRLSVKEDKLRSLTVVNPDQGARRRARDIMRAGLSRATRVLSFRTFGQFAAADSSLWR